MYVPQSQTDISKLLLYPERFTEGAGIIDSVGPNRNKEDIVVISRIVITRVNCTYHRDTLYNGPFGNPKFSLETKISFY